MLEEKMKLRLEELTKARQDFIDKANKEIEKYTVVISELEQLLSEDKEVTTESPEGSD